MKHFLSGFGAALLLVVAFAALAGTLTNPVTRDASSTTATAQEVCVKSGQMKIWIEDENSDRIGALTITDDGAGGVTCNLQGEVAETNTASCGSLTSAQLGTRVTNGIAQGNLGLTAAGITD